VTRTQQSGLPRELPIVIPLVTAMLLSLTSALGAGLARAGEPSAATEEVADGPLQEIVVTATRKEESLSKVAISVTALTQEALDIRGIKDFQDVARFTPGVNIDNSGTNNISIRGISSTGGAGTTGIYIDDTPIQIRALAFNPDDALPKSFDIDRIEVLRGPQGTLFGAGSEGGTVRYLTTQPSLRKTSTYARSELSFTQGGDASYEGGVAVGGPLIEGTFGARASVWYRRDGGWIDRINPVTQAMEDKHANYDRSYLIRLAAVWAPNDKWTLTPGIYYQNRYRNDAENYWPIYSKPGSNRFVSANPTQRFSPDTFYLPSLKIEGDLGAVRLISNTSYYHRKNTTGYDGTLYNIGFYQTLFDALPGPLLDATGLHMDTFASYRSPAQVENGQQNFTQEVRLQSSDSSSRLAWTAGLFYSVNRQSYLERIIDPSLPQFLEATYALAGLTPPDSGDYVSDFFGIGYDPSYPQDSYFLKTEAKDEQTALFGEGSWAFSDALKLTVGARFSRTKFSFTTATGGPQLFGPNAYGEGSQQQNSFTPKVSLGYQRDPRNLFYFTYAKGFRPGGANNPVPAVACADDFATFGITEAPTTYQSDSVDSIEVGAKNNFNNRVKIASSVYYIKWNDIQQTVVPPTCQITFIANLGEAVAKGADVQAEIAMGDSLTMEVAAGYTDARYSKDAKFSNLQVTPIVANGNAIVGQGGQPGTPFTASVGLEYRFKVAARDSYVRADYAYNGAPRWKSAAQDGPAPVAGQPCEAGTTLQFDCANYSLPATSFLTLRGGATFGDWQIAAFVDNLGNSHTVTNYDYSIGADGPDTRLKREYTFRPRTIGLTFTYRK
jgi:iron complex outermembrane recepter protein